jgi:regulation of enolase protein 1 (concanavalin A-like superfamily)
MFTPGSGPSGRLRANGGKTTSIQPGAAAAGPLWLRATRVGTTVTTYASSNGSTWTTLSSGSVALGTSAYVGLAVTSGDVRTRATATISNVRLTRLAALPGGQQTVDIGDPAVRGNAAYSAGKYTIQGAGSDIWSAADQFRFVYQPVTGDVDIVARVASIANTHEWAKAGVMIRESLTAESRHALMVTSVAKGYAFQRRLDPAGLSVHTSGGAGAPPGWVRLVRRGDLFEAYRSANGTSWTKVGSDTIAMTDTVYVGLAVTSHNAGAATTAVIDGLTIAAVTPANQAPAVSVTAPASGSQVAQGTSLTVTATASDPENRLLSVDFYAGSTLIVRDPTSPYSAAWTPSAAGSYVLTAVAHDADGGSTTSGSVSVIVTAPPSAPPRAVVFTASPDHATVTSYLLEVFAAGANPATATPVGASNLGKPTPASNNDITVDRATFFTGLPTGSFIATVTAISPGGRSRSEAVPFTR